MGDQKTQQPSEHVAKPPEKHVAALVQTIDSAAYSTDTHILSRLSNVGSLPPVPGKGLSHPTAAAHQAAMLRTLQRRQGNAFVQRAVVQGRSTAGTSEHAVDQAQSDRSPGQSLESSVQTDMEAHFRHDFSGVRIHKDGRAADLAQGVNAQAFTREQDIYFGAGRYQPGTTQGKHLLAHELTHTIQQGSAQPLARSTIQLRHTVSDPDEPMEQEAEAVASQIVDSRPLTEKTILTVGSDNQGLIARNGDPQAPDKQAIDMTIINNAVDIIIKGLKGITTKSDSANILAQFQGQNAATVHAIIQELKNRGKQNEKTSEEMVDWLFEDMTAEDSRKLRQLLIQLGVVQDIAHIVAASVIKRLKGYTTDEESQEILTALSEFKGAGLDEVLIQLENQTGKSNDQMSDWLFGDMERVNSERLRQHFFQNGAQRATRYAIVRTASKIMSLLSGYTSHADSSSIVWNFEHSPEEYRRLILGLLDQRTRTERSQPAGEALMHDMDQSDYETLTRMPGLSSLPAYHETRGIFTRIISGLEWAEVAVEVLAGGVVGIVTGLLSAIGGIIGSVIDIAVAAKHLVMSFLYLVSYGAIGSEDWLAVKEFFSGIKGLSDPGALLKQAWEETKLESSTIEGPFEYGRRAEFWVRKAINLIVNIVLIAAAGYGLVKAGVAAVTEVATLIDKFGVIGGLAKAGRQALRAIGKLITHSAKEARDLLALLRKPLQTLAAIGQKINGVLLAIEDQGLWAFLRGRTSALAEDEIRFWREQRQTWRDRAMPKQKQYGDLLDETNTLQGELEQKKQAPPSPVENIKGIDEETDQLKKDVDQLEKDILGKEQPKEPDLAPEPTHEEPSAKPPTDEKTPTPPEGKPADTTTAREKAPGETEAEKKPSKREQREAAMKAEREQKAAGREAAAREKFEQTKERLQQENAGHRQKIEELTGESERLEAEAKRLRSEAREAEKAGDKVGRERAKSLREEALENSEEADAVRRTRREHWDSIEDNNKTLMNKEAQLKQPLPCFSGDTHVVTLVGPVRIDQIQPGESLFSFDFEREEVIAGRVIQVFVNKTHHFYDIQVEGTVIHATGAHRFWIEDDAQWIAARDLKIGMQCKLIDGGTATVTAISLREDLESPTYNLNVDIDHNYFVGPGILVHNAGVARYEFGDLIIYEARNPKFPGKVYIGQTNDLIRRQNEHRYDASKALENRSQLSAEEIEFREFMEGAELEPRIEGLNQVQADYMERKNVQLEMKLNESKVMNRNLKKEDIARMEELEQEIIEGGYCPE